MGKWRGYVVSSKGPKGRQAMRDSGKTFKTKAEAIKNMKSDNKKWMTKNYSSQYVKDSGFEYGAVQDGKFKDGMEGNKKLLKWHDANTKGRQELLGKRGFMQGELQEQLRKANAFAKKNLYPPGTY